MYKILKCLFFIFCARPEARNILRLLEPRQKIRFFFRVLCYPFLTLSWLDYITHHPFCAQANSFNLYKRLQKPLRPYLNKSYNAKERLNALIAHYDFIAAIFGSNPYAYLAIKESGLELAKFSGKQNNEYVLVLIEPDHFDREGELLLTLIDVKSQNRIATVAFVISNSAESRLDIGCLQGSKKGGECLVQNVTRDIFGIRPKNLLMFALYDLANIWGIQSIRAINNTQRIYAKRRGIFKNRKHAKADYDAFWKELDGIYQERGWFSLPQQLKQRALKEVPSKHRAEHRRKLNLRNDIFSQMQMVLPLLEENRSSYSGAVSDASA